MPKKLVVIKRTKFVIVLWELADEVALQHSVNIGVHHNHPLDR